MRNEEQVKAEKKAWTRREERHLKMVTDYIIRVLRLKILLCGICRQPNDRLPMHCTCFKCEKRNQGIIIIDDYGPLSPPILQKEPSDA